MNVKLSAAALGVSLVALLVASWGSISAVNRAPEMRAATQGELVRSTETIHVQMNDLERRNADLRTALTTAEQRLKIVETAYASTEEQLENVDSQIAALEESNEASTEARLEELAKASNRGSFTFGGTRTTTRFSTDGTETTTEEEEQEEEPKLEDFLTIETNMINGVPGPHIILTGVNLHLRSGSGATDDLGGLTLGLGNVIIGYNELGDTLRARNGSHNLIVGADHGFSSFAGLVAGISNEVNEPNCSVTGGSGNQANAWAASISGGEKNLATADFSSVSGGLENHANAENASVSGGKGNIASGLASSVSGGLDNEAAEENASVTGGMGNEASGLASSVTGGQGNFARGEASSVTGGLGNQVISISSAISGGVDLILDRTGWSQIGSLSAPPN